jgi:hypothetical protein
MKKFSDFLKERCWPGYKSVPGKKAYSPGSCMKEEDMEEGWSQKYKSSIDCNNPKGFSQKAHCAGKKKNENVNESAAAAIAAATAIAKKKSGNYDEKGFRKTPYKNPDHPNRKSNTEREAELKEDLRKWFSKTDPAGGWKRINSKGEAIGPCAREPGEPKPKCMSNEKRASLTKKERASAVASKRRNDPNPERQGKPINVSNFGKGKISEDMENLDEKNVPTSPEKWAQAKSQAKAKFDVYPSAYANGWASKKYKAMGGGWKSVSEDNEVTEGAVPAQEKIITVKHKTSGKTLRISAAAAAKYRMQGYHYHPVNEAKDEQEYGYEGDMALNQLATLIRCGEMIKDLLKPDTDMPEWVQSKITLATDYIQTAADYMYSEMKESVEQIDEVSLKTASSAFAKRIGQSKPSSQDKALQTIRHIAKKHGASGVATAAKTAEKEAIKKIHQEEVEQKHKEIDTHTEVEDGSHQDKNDTKDLHDRVKAAAKKHGATITYQDRPSLRGSHTISARGSQDFHKEVKHIASDYEHLGVQHDINEEVELDESHKVGDSVIVNSKFFGKQKGKVVKVDNQSVHVQRNNKKYSEKYPHDSVMKESTDSDGGPPTEAAATLTVTGQPKLNKTVGQTKLIPYVQEDKETKPPFDKPYTTTKAVVKDKSGAKHTPMSRARDLARKAMARNMKEQSYVAPNPFTVPEIDIGKAPKKTKATMAESRQLEIVREAMKVAKKKKEVTEAGTDKFIADPELSSQITKSNP